MDRPNYRTVVQTEEFLEELRAINPEQRIADEFVRATEWALCRYPKLGTPIAPNSDVWFLPIADIPFLPPYGIYYKFDDTKVWLLSIREGRMNE